MARFIRAYNTPSNSNANTLGFSSGIAMAAYDPELVDWLEHREYSVETESPEQLLAHTQVERVPDSILRAIHLGHLGQLNNAPESSNISLFPQDEYYTVEGICIPKDSVSASHLQIEPRLRPHDVEPLGLCLSSLKAIWDGGLRKHFFVDNRTVPAPSTDSVLYAWG